jgi:hypothetical protein
MKTQTIVTYKFNELSESAKERAIDEYRQCSLDDEWYEGTVEKWKESASLIGIDIDNIYFSGFYSQGDGACFTGSYQYKKGWKKSLEKATGGGELYKNLKNIGEQLQAEQKKHFYDISAVIEHTGRYSHENSVTISVEPGEIRYSFCDNHTEENVADALRELMQDIYSSLREEYEYLTSDEYVGEVLIDSEHEFTENGEIWPLSAESACNL